MTPTIRQSLIAVAGLLAIVCGVVAVRDASQQDPRQRGHAPAPSQRATEAARLHQAAQAVVAEVEVPTARAPLQAELPASFTQGVNIIAAGTTVTATPIGARPARKTGTPQGTATYVDAWPGVDVVQEPSASWLKESLVLRNGSLGDDRRGTFAFQLAGRPVPSLTPAGDIAFREGRATLGLRIPAPRAVDASGELLPASATRYRLTGRRLSIDVTLPPGATYPVTVDPTFTTGQGADHVIGKTGFDNADDWNGRGLYGFYRPMSLASDGTKLIVGDINRAFDSRSLSVFNTIPATNATPQDTQWNTTYEPTGLWTNGTKWIVADYLYHRIRVMNAFNQSYNFTLGQTDSVGYQPNTGGRSSSTLYYPGKVWSDGTMIAVADTYNHRVLIWNSWPTSDGQPADLILGQANGTDGSCNRGGARAADTMCYPRGVYSDGTRFYVADSVNHRVLVWNTMPSTPGQAADLILGQSVASGGTCNSGSVVSRARLCEPYSVNGEGGKIVVSDYRNQRALVWNAPPSSNGQASDVILGTTGVAGTTQTQLRNPLDAIIASGKVIVADYSNHRVMIWNSVPGADSAPADVVMGHQVFTTNGIVDNQGDQCYVCTSVEFDSIGRLFVHDRESYQHLRYPATLPATGAVADYSVAAAIPGQERTTGGLDRTPGWWTSDLTIADDNTLLTTITDESRVVWNNSVPTSNPPPVYDGVVGQATLLQQGENRNMASAGPTTLNRPYAADWDGTHLAVADTYNNRVLIWNGKPANGDIPADVVLGQPDFVSSAPNSGGVSANSLFEPRGIVLSGGRLYVSDTGNNRVLIWNDVPATSQAAADIVLGQPSMYTRTASTGSTGLSGPRALDVSEGMLAVADSFNRRVLLWDTLPTTTWAPASRVIGQPNMTSTSCSRLQAGLCYPEYIALRDGRLAINDEQRRVLVYDDVSAPTISGVSEVVAGENATINWTTDEDASAQVVWDTTSHALAAEYTFSASSPGRRRAHAVSAGPLTSGVTYYYRVVSADARGNISVSGESTFVSENTTLLRASNGSATDTTLDEGQPTYNNGGASELVVGGGPADRSRSLIRFGLDQIPSGATILGATLTLHQTDAGSGSTPTIDVRTVTTGWEEGSGDGTVEPVGATWPSVDGVDPWTSAGGDASSVVASASAPATTPATMPLDVTAQIDDWVSGATPNEGLLLQMTPEASGETRRFASSEHPDPTLRPTLEIHWHGRDITQPLITSFRTQPLSSSSVRVLWDTDEPTSSRLEYGTTTSYGTEVADPVADNAHQVDLTGLQPTTTYHVRVTATDAQGNQSVSTDLIFRTSYREVIYADDATVREDKPNRNAGGQGSLFVGNANGSWTRARSVLHFDVSGLPPSASIRSATARMVLAGQATAGAPTLDVVPLARPFTQGTGNPTTAPGATTNAGYSPSDPAPLLSSAERHMLLTPSGWWQFTGQPNIHASTYMYHRKSYDGMTFSGDALFGRFGWAKHGLSLVADGGSAWSAAFDDGSSTLRVAEYDANTSQETDSGSFAMPSDIQYHPSMDLADDGRIWIKGESPDGQVWVTRSTGARNPSTWSAATLVVDQTTPAGATLAPLSGGNMLLISQDGGQLSSFEGNGATWGGAQPIAADAAVPTPWYTRTSFAAESDGAGGAWVVYAVAGGGVKAAHYSGGVWSAASTVSLTGTAVALSLDTNANEPVVFWQNGTTLLRSRYSAGAWQAPVTLPVTLPATTTQLAATQPSNEALGITWARPTGSAYDIVWYGMALDKPADGATWNTSDGSTPWTAAGGDEAGAPITSLAAPNSIGGVLSFDLTPQVEDWYTGAVPNDGLLLRQQTENPALNEWKSFYSREAVSPSLRPALTIDYDIAAVTITQPTSATAWKSSSVQTVTWQVTGSGMTQVELRYSTDGGATWPHLITASAPNTGTYQWTTPAAEGTYAIQVLGKNASNDVLASDESSVFVIDDAPPDAVTELSAPSPTNMPALVWSEPADTGGAGMANGAYRIYRSTSNGALGVRIATVPTESYDDNSSLSDGSYYYTVLPVDAAGNVQVAGNLQIAVNVDTQQPNAVTDLAGPALTNGSASLTWSAVADNGLAGMGTYRVYRSSTSGVLGTLVTTVGTPGATTTPPSDGTWYYTALPVDLAGNARSAGNNQIAVVADTVAPTGTSVTLNGGAVWTASTGITAALGATGATEYQVSEDPAFTAATWQAMAASVGMVLAGDGTHIVYARFRDAAGNVSASVSDSIGLDTTPPTAVTPVVPSPAASMVVSWSAASDGSGAGVDHYEVYRSTVSGSLGSSVASPVGTTATDTPPADGTYYYTVRGVDALGNQRTGGDTQTTAVFDATPPGAVSDAAPSTNPTNVAVALTWSASTDATTSVATYRVYRSASSGSLGALVTSVAGTSASNTPPSDGTWYYTVRAVDAAGNEQLVGNNQTSVVYDTTAPTAVSDAAVTTSPTNAPLALSWSAVTDATTSVASYRVYRSATSGPLGALLTTTAGTSTTDTPPGEGTWYYTVRAVDVLGNERLIGNNQTSGVYDTTAPLPNPMSATGAATSPTQITWTADVATDETLLHTSAYSIDTGAPTWQASRTFVEGSLSANTSYTRTVRARDAAGNVRIGTVQRFTHPNVVTGETATPRHWTGSGYRVLLAWTAPVGGAATYNIRSAADGYASVVLNTASLTQTITGLAAETLYTYKICAVNADGAQETTCSSAVSATTALAPPASVSSSNILTTSADLDWPDVAGAAGYDVYLYSDAACTAQVGGPVSVVASDWSAASLDLDTYYAVQVRTRNAAGYLGAPTACTELASATKRTAIGVALDAGAQDLGRALPGQSMSGATTLTTTTFGSPGYSINASLDHQPTKGLDVIPATTSGTIASPGPWFGTGFGITVSSGTALDPKWASGSNFAALTTTPTQIHTTGSSAFGANSANATDTTIGYRMAIPPTQPAGTYSTTVTFAVVPAP